MLFWIKYLIGYSLFLFMTVVLQETYIIYGLG